MAYISVNATSWNDKPHDKSRDLIMPSHVRRACISASEHTYTHPMDNNRKKNMQTNKMIFF